MWQGNSKAHQLRPIKRRFLFVFKRKHTTTCLWSKLAGACTAQRRTSGPRLPVLALSPVVQGAARL